MPTDQPEAQWRLVIHGGAGIIERGRLDPGEEQAIRAALNLSVEAGAAVLDGGGGALDAVEAAVRVLEDDPHFNAGRGSVFTYDGADRDGRLDHGRARPQCRRGDGRNRDSKPDRPRPRG